LEDELNTYDAAKIPTTDNVNNESYHTPKTSFSKRSSMMRELLEEADDD